MWKLASSTRWSFERAPELSGIEENAAYRILIRDRNVRSRKVKLASRLDMAFGCSLLLAVFVDFATAGSANFGAILLVIAWLMCRVVILRFQNEVNFLGVVTPERLREIQILPITDDDYASAYWARHVDFWPRNHMWLPLVATIVLYGIILGAAGDPVTLVVFVLPAIIWATVSLCVFYMDYRALPFSALSHAIEQVHAELRLHQLQHGGRVDPAYQGKLPNPIVLLVSVLIMIWISYGMVGGINHVIAWSQSGVHFFIMALGTAFASASVTFILRGRTNRFDRDREATQFRSLVRDVRLLRSYLLIEADSVQRTDQS